MDEQMQMMDQPNVRDSSDSSAASLSVEATGFIGNGSFETGDFSNWNTIGDTSIETEDLGIFPTDGTSQALITSGASDSGGSVVDSDLEEFFDLPIGSLDGLTGGDATEGSAIKQTFTAEAGDVVSFDWNFLTNELTPNESFNDTGFVSVNGFTFELADTSANFSDAADVEGFSSQTGTETLTFSIATAGTYTIGFGAVDVGDSAVDSGLAIDNINIASSNADASGIASLNTSDSLGTSPSIDLVLGENGFESVDGSLMSGSESDLMLNESDAEIA